jgi:hypothetical protein
LSGHGDQILGLAATVVMHAGRSADAAEIETQRRHACRDERPRDGMDHLVAE